MFKRGEKTASKRLLQAGQMIRARRVQLGLTLQQLGEKAGLSPAFISLVERNKASPSLVSLLNLARALDVKASAFMEIPAGEALVRRRSDPQHIEVDSPVEYNQLSACMRFQQMDAIFMRIPTGHVFPDDQREGEDFLYVIKGELYCELGDEKVTLAEGDSMHFNARTVHNASNLTDSEVELLYVGTPSVFGQND